MTNDAQGPLLGRLREELGTFGAELAESLALRWRLAMLEIKADLRSACRLAIAWTIAAALGLGTLPVLLVALAMRLAGSWGISTAGWLLIEGAVLVLLAPLVGWLAWRRFRRRFVGLEQTLEELHEDAVWLRESVGSRR